MSPKRIVYFVGAGLSKALERPGKRIPLMYHFVSVMADYTPHDKVILQTLARLDYSGAFIWPFPETARLANRILWDRADPTRDMLDHFANAMKRRPAESIEDLLVRALQNANRSVGSDSETLRTSLSANAPRPVPTRNLQAVWPMD